MVILGSLLFIVSFSFLGGYLLNDDKDWKWVRLGLLTAGVGVILVLIGVFVTGK